MTCKRRGFERVALKSGGSQRVRFQLRDADFEDVVHPGGLSAAAAAEWAVELGPVGRALAASVAAPWASSADLLSEGGEHDKLLLGGA